MMDFFVTICYLFFIVAPIGTIIHETGHVIGARLVKADYIQLSIGLGKEIGSFSFKNFHLKLHLLFFLGGFVTSNRIPAYQPKEWVLISIFGPLHNLFYVVLFYFLNVYQVHEYVQLLVGFNLWLAVVNIIPFKINKRPSDGYTILKTLLNK